MHIIYHFKAFEKGFQMNVNANRNISSTFQSTLKNSGDINWSIFVRMSVISMATNIRGFLNSSISCSSHVHISMVTNIR